MVYLIVAVICSSLFAVIFKICQRKGVDTDQVILFNYIVGALFSWIPILLVTVGETSGMSFSDFSLPPLPLAMAVMMGCLYLLGFTVMDRSTARTGVALTTVTARSSLVLPLVLCWAFLGDARPEWLPVAGLIAAMLLIILPGREKSDRTGAEHRRAVAALALVFLVYGISDFSLKVSQKSIYNLGGDDFVIDCRLTALTGYIFVVSSIGAALVCIFKGSFAKHGLSWKAVGLGALLGLANSGCVSCMLRALAAMPAGQFYPLYNIGIVVVGTLAGVLIFRERMKWLQLAGFALAVLALSFIF